MVQNQRDFKLIFPTVIQMTMVSDHEDLNTQLNREVDEIRDATPNSRPASWSCDVYTTIGNNFLLHQRPGFHRLSALFSENAERYGRALDYPMDTYGVSMEMCWLNAYRRGQSQERHTHINYVFSGIYYLKAPPGASKLDHPCAHVRYYVGAEVPQAHGPQYPVHGDRTARGIDAHLYRQPAPRRQGQRHR